MSIIEVEDLRKGYGNKIALRGISFTVERGEIFGIIGPNGAGKTTTVECVDGLRRPDSGTVRVLGLDPQRDGRRLRHRVGVQLQESELPERLTVREALNLYASFYPDPADPGRLIKDWGLTEKRDTAFGRLSGGQKQRLFIALALIGSPEIAVLDELTTGLDPQARRGAWSLIEAIRDRGVTVVLVTHFMEEAERLCDRIAVINDGWIVALDTPGGLVDRLAGGQRIMFRPSAAVPDGLLSSLPGVTGVQQSGGQLMITGTGPVLQSVAVALDRHSIRADDLRLERATLEDAFVTLTGRPYEN